MRCPTETPRLLAGHRLRFRGLAAVADRAGGPVLVVATGAVPVAGRAPLPVLETGGLCRDGIAPVSPLTCRDDGRGTVALPSGWRSRRSRRLTAVAMRAAGPVLVLATRAMPVAGLPRPIFFPFLPAILRGHAAVLRRLLPVSLLRVSLLRVGLRLLLSVALLAVSLCIGRLRDFRCHGRPLLIHLQTLHRGFEQGQERGARAATLPTGEWAWGGQGGLSPGPSARPTKLQSSTTKLRSRFEVFCGWGGPESISLLGKKIFVMRRSKF